MRRDEILKSLLEIIQQPVGALAYATGLDDAEAGELHAHIASVLAPVVHGAKPWPVQLPFQAWETCREAASLTAGNREKQHGDRPTNFSNIARLWQAYLETRRDPVAPLSAADVAHMNILQKMARTQSGGLNPDDWIDMAGYAGVAGEVAQVEQAIEAQRAQEESGS